MDAAKIFQIGNSFIILGWILLVFVPKWKHTQSIVLNGIIALYSLVYSYLILKDIGDFNPESFNSLANVKALFQNDNAVAAGWFHYLAFDLFVGAYIVRKSITLGISRILYTLALPFTFMFGPMGYLIFFLIKSLKTKSLT
jgi:uncharacterized membrane protein